MPIKPTVLSLTLMIAGVAGAHDHTRPAAESIHLVAAQAASDAVERSIQIIDEATGNDLPGCIRVRPKDAENDSWLPLPSLLSRVTGLSKDKTQLGWYVLPHGKAEVDLPKGTLQIEAISGLEYSAASVTTDQRKVQIRLKRLFDPASDQWIPGNTHLHLMRLTRGQADRYLTEVPRADGLRVVFVSYLERAFADAKYISNRYSKSDLSRLSTNHTRFGTGEEYRHNIGGGGEGYGHVLLLEHANQILPASIGPGITNEGTDGTPLRPGIDLARSDGGSVIWCHNAFGFEDLPNWLTDRIDAQNIFDGGSQGSYEESFYRYLNLGMRVPFSTGTDWFIYDFSRVYVQMDRSKPVTAKNWLDALKAGRSVITNGPWIQLRVDEAGIGGTITTAGPKTVIISALATGRHDFEALEIIRNGTVIESTKAIQGSTSLRLELKLEKPSWIAARIKSKREVTNELDEPIFAHTSPVYITMNGQHVYDSDAAREVAAELEKSITEIKENGKFDNDGEREGVLKIYRAAISDVRAGIQ